MPSGKQLQSAWSEDVADVSKEGVSLPFIHPPEKQELPFSEWKLLSQYVRAHWCHGV